MNNLVVEFPVRGGPIDTDVFDDHEKNFAYVLATKKHVKLIDKYKKYEVYQFVTTNNNLHDVFIFGDFVSAYFNYSISDDFIVEKKIWQDNIQLGLFRDIMFNYYLTKYKGLISDVVHSLAGEKYWKKILKQAVGFNYKTYVLKNEKEKIPLLNLDDVDNYFNSVSYRFVIEK